MKKILGAVITVLSIYVALGTPSLTAQSQLLLLGAGRASPVSAGTTARAFNGSSDLADNTTPYLSGIATSFTVAMWVKPANLTQTNTYFLQARQNGGDGWAIIWEFTDNQFEFYAQNFTGTDPRTSSGITLSDTNWHHIAYRYDGTHWDKFLDGTKTSINASIVFVLPAIVTTPHFTLGCQSNGAGACAGNYVNTAAARLYISTSALTDGQISALAGATCSSSGVSGTVGYWLLAGASPEPESSPSPNTNALTLTGTTTTTGPTCSGS